MSQTSSERTPKIGTGIEGRVERKPFEDYAAELMGRAIVAYGDVKRLIRQTFDKLGLLEGCAVLRPEALHDPAELVCTEIDRRGLSAGGIVAFGEDHYWSGALAQEQTLVAALQEKYGPKFKKVFLEEKAGLQPCVAEYYATGVMPKRLEEYLLHGFTRRGAAGGGYDYKLELVKLCHDLQIPVEFVDYGEEEGRDQTLSDRMSASISEQLDGLYVAIGGLNHMSKHPNARGADHTAVSLLGEKYGGERILSICSLNSDPQQESIRKATGGPGNQILDDLAHLHAFTKPTAMITCETPYGAMPFAPKIGMTFAIQEAFDILEHCPGVSLLPKESPATQKAA
ncbi:hypothetical protein CO015_02140 [candidate division WWE3 bacterium CG_4_8_14_3_um_filter_42_11]|uniref:Uncharacterized protein n=1 Tax=candidate division WWE3 bacterium CG_4_8_14_3_um_filter_42_11 TaxID=1975076 RepID=A0A2M8G773_UNCKA|nr:MAG: hypothetical protein CO015_02140 [candidate division WWE3 bacterium CG_4_8_14_3_um_filter_42_11]